MGRKAVMKERLFDIWYRPDYFERHSIPNPATGCIEWNGPSHRQGYGMVGAWRASDNEGIMTTTHRIAARHKFQRAIASDEWVLHTCSNPKCVNPDHLEIGDRSRIHEIMKANNRYDYGRGRPRGSYNKKQKSP